MHHHTASVKRMQTAADARAALRATVGYHLLCVHLNGVGGDGMGGAARAVRRVSNTGLASEGFVVKALAVDRLPA